MNVIGGSAVAGAIVCTPGPGMLNMMVEKSMLLLASLIAWRSDPAPESFVLVTVKVLAADRDSGECGKHDPGGDPDDAHGSAP